MRVVARQHVVEGGHRARAVAAELRGLRAQQLRQRFVVEKAVGLARIAMRLARIARADGDHAARERRKTLLPPPRAHRERGQRRDAQHEAQQREGERERDGGRQHDAERHHQRDIVFDAAPGQRNRAGIVGEPRQSPGRKAQNREEGQ